MDALKVIEAFEAMIQPITALKPAIEQAKAAERIIKDLDLRKQKGEQELQAIDKRVQTKKDELDRARLGHEKQLEDSRLLCVKIRADAKTEAAEIVKAANDAKDIVLLEIEKLKSDVIALQDTIESKKAEILKMRHEYNSVNEQRTRAFAELEKMFKGRA